MKSGALPLLEALCDPRVGGLPAAETAGLDADLVETEGGVARLRPAARQRVAGAVEEAVRGRVIEWASRTTSQGEVLDDFARHCRDELGEVELVESGPTALELRWRREAATVELRAGLVGAERLGAERPAAVIAPLGDRFAERLAAEPALRQRLAVYDLAALTKAGAVRSSIPVFLEWFLGEAYGVKVLASPAFTQGLVARGVISLGMG